MNPADSEILDIWSILLLAFCIALLIAVFTAIIKHFITHARDARPSRRDH